jgi:hypothetical protein
MHFEVFAASAAAELQAVHSPRRGDSIFHDRTVGFAHG